MKHKTWFRLVIKAIGIALLAFALPQLIGQIGTIVWIAFNDPYQMSGFSWIDIFLPQALGPMMTAFVQFAIGLYLFFGGGLIVGICIPSNRPYCPSCGYELLRIDLPQCSECGCVLRSEAPGETFAKDAFEAAQQSSPEERSGLARMIPYKNPTALTAYYLAVASFVPLLGLFLAPFAIGCGMNGLKRAKWNPGKGGAAHAWVAIVLGALVLLGHLMALCLAILFYNLFS